MRFNHLRVMHYSKCRTKWYTYQYGTDCSLKGMMLRSMIRFENAIFQCRLHLGMKKLSSPILFLILAITSAFAHVNDPDYKSQDVSETDGVPILIKHLPDWENVRSQTKLTNSIAEVRKEFGESPILSEIDLAGGAEAAIASYGEGKLLLIEYPTPQGSIAADASIQSKLNETPNAVYRRIGNYNAIVFNVSDPAAANALLDDIRYGKVVQWLGEDPYLLQKFERYVASTGRDVAISTVFFILGIFATAILLGVGTGYAYFRFREQQKAQRTAFSDAGGLTRLNLDELSD